MTYTVVTEYIAGTIGEPKIFSDPFKAQSCFVDCLGENEATVVHTDDFCRIGEGRNYKVFLHTKLEIQ